MTRSGTCPALRADFSLVGVQERIVWRDSLAHHVLSKMDVPDWKKQEQIEPVNATVAILLSRGFTDPVTIASRILKMGSSRNEDATS